MTSHCQEEVTGSSNFTTITDPQPLSKAPNSTSNPFSPKIKLVPLMSEMVTPIVYGEGRLLTIALPMRSMDAKEDQMGLIISTL